MDAWLGGRGWVVLLKLEMRAWIALCAMYEVEIVEVL